MPAIPRAVLAWCLLEGASGAVEKLGCANGANVAAAACARGDGGMWLMQKRQRKEKMEPPPHEDADVGFTWLQGACRTASGSTGTFNLFEASERDCRQACLSNPLCLAYEFRHPDRCESHFEAIEYAQSSMTDFSCHVRTLAGTPAPSPAPTQAPTPLPTPVPASPTPAPAQGFTHWQGACRTESGSRGVFSVVVADGAECQRRCSADASCVAVELGPGERCELHREAIHRAEPSARGYACLVRGSAASPTTAPAPAPAPPPPPTQAPTLSPTSAPTPPPTSEPTLAPTPSPTSAPTPSPTLQPTPAPTAAPTGAPTPAPAPSPTTTPSPAPTPSPTPQPTPAPTAAPTGAPTPAPAPSATTAPSPAPVPSPRSSDGFPLDGFGIKQLFPPGGANRDWSAEWQQARTGYGNTAQDGDFGASFRGGSSNKFVIGQGVMTMENEGDKTNTPRYYIHRNNENVEFTAYFWVDEADYYGGSSKSKGPTLVVRSNHHLASDSTPCEARGYYMRFTPAEKTLRFLKEKYHGNGQTKYTFLRKGSPKAAFPWSQWVGLKFIARTKANGDVDLRVYMDLADGVDGGDWTLEVEYTDSISDSESMYGCPHASAFGEGAVAMIRADSLNPIFWKKATLREVAAYSQSGPLPWDHSSQAVV